MKRCDYCNGLRFVRNLRGGLECAGRGAPAPEGDCEAKIAQPLAPVAILKYPGVLSAAAITNLKQAWNDVFPGQRVIILEEGLDVTFLGGFHAGQ